jgi:pyruvate dehydrogenase E2 component (dihydrolipoamide acetyltransferase)
VPIEVTMPKLSPTMETGVIVQWLVKVGDQVKEGDALADIETDKATMPMKSYDDGTIVHFDHAAGDEVKLGERVLVLAKKGEDTKKVALALGLGQADDAARKPAAAKSSATKSPAASGARESAAVAPSCSAGNGQQQPSIEEQSPGGRLRISPLARKLAESSHVDLSRVRGSGPGGRIVRRDIESFVQGEPAVHHAPTPVETKPSAPPSAPPTTATRPSPTGAPLVQQRIPHTRMRKTIAQRMLQSKQSAPAIHLMIEARVDRLVSAREEINKRLARDGIKLSLADFVTKAVATALRLHPGLNASFEPDAIVRHGEINIGIAVALDEGLIVPVLHNADKLGLVEIRIHSEKLATAARANTLTTEQLTGGTFTISNLGMYGTRQFDAILNLPEVGILAVGAALKRPVVVGDQLTVGTVMTLTLTADHRAVDGAMGAEFLRTLQGLLEEPVSMFV